MTNDECREFCIKNKPNMTYRELVSKLKEEFGVIKSEDQARNYVNGSRFAAKKRKEQERRNEFGIDDKDVLESRGYDPTKWRVTNYRRDGLSVKPIINSVTTEDVENFFENYHLPKPIVEPLYVNYNKEGDTLIVELPDLHVGLLSWGEETGDDYDISIAESRLSGCIADIVQRCSERAFKKIIVVTLGDLIHVDNADGATTKGTKQDIDGRMPKIFDSVITMLIDTLDRLRKIAPIEVIYIPGNHDEIVGRMAVRAVELAYNGIDEVTFDCSPTPRKARLVGCTIIGFTHGNMPQNNSGSWLTSDFRSEYGMAKHSEVHSAHFHTEKEKEFFRTDSKDGIVVRSLPTICSSSAWENSQAYSKGLKTLLSYVFNDKIGLREIWYSNT
jgi:metallophosphoesterase superfamily enzyme